MKTSDCDLMYRQNGKVSHLVPYGDPRALCGMEPTEPLDRSSWFGTGDWSEYERAVELSLCVLCEEEIL